MLPSHTEFTALNGDYKRQLLIGQTPLSHSWRRAQEEIKMSSLRSLLYVALIAAIGWSYCNVSANVSVNDISNNIDDKIDQAMGVINAHISESNYINGKLLYYYMYL